MKNLIKSLFIAIVVAGTPLLAMQPPTTVAVHRQNKAASQANQAQYQNQPFFTLFVMQPAHGYQTLNNCVNLLVGQNRLPAGYQKIPANQWHISTIAFAIPFVGQPNAAVVQQAARRLQTIVQRYINSFRRVAYRYRRLSGIGTNKFLAAHYDFSSGRTSFLNAYAKIVRDFMARYNRAYMYYGYRTVPHISVASTANPGRAVNVNIAGCGRIRDVALLHGGRRLYVAGSFYNPQTGAIERIRPLVI